MSTNNVRTFPLNIIVMMTLFLLLSVAFIVVLICMPNTAVTSAYEWSSSASAAGSSSRPEVNRRAIAGIWKLTTTTVAVINNQQPTPKIPMKEFTVYPKKEVVSHGTLSELFLVLHEDGSFRQYDTEHNHDSQNKWDVQASWKQFLKKKQAPKKQQGLIKGTWDYIDGNLILAPDRPERHKPSYNSAAVADGYQQQHQPQPGSSSSNSNTEMFGRSETSDTVLKGRVVASYQTRLLEEDLPPMLMEDAVSSSSKQTNSTRNADKPKTITTTTALDTHLLVPKGSIHIGKFFYPKHHPAFFEQPIFQPVKKGTFVLRQILGSLNMARDTQSQTHAVEQFQRRDFYNKTFLLTSHPLKQPPSPNNNKKKNMFNNNNNSARSSSSSMANIRVMQVAFHANNTFSTVAGLGESAILRGKFDIIGEEKNQLWMQVMRFGFGRSVSGSVYSEGRMLTHEDAKTYWGSIQVQEETIDDNNCNNIDDQSKELDNNNHHREPMSRLEVVGSVLVGWGLEPLPVARFIMRETTDQYLTTAMEEEEDDDDDEEVKSENMAKLDPGLQGDGIDWSTTEDGGMFQ
jgi:hypothetical protein